jgi:hypothetical protein
VRVYGFGVDELAARRAKYTYFDDSKGAHNAHSFLSQSRFLKVLARESGRVVLCVPDHDTEAECNGTARSSAHPSRAATHPHMFADWDLPGRTSKII